jgi:hypothetical protein
MFTRPCFQEYFNGVRPGERPSSSADAVVGRWVQVDRMETRIESAPGFSA